MAVIQEDGSAEYVENEEMQDDVVSEQELHEVPSNQQAEGTNQMEIAEEFFQ